MNEIRALLAHNNLWLAPMAGVGDPIFRALCRAQGAGMTYTEMVSAKGLSYDNERTFQMLTLAPGEHQAAVQLLGAEPQIMADEAARIEQDWGETLAFIDINMGCPVAKVTRKGEGCALMKTPELAARIIAAVVSAVSVPVTVKFRAGWDDNHRTAPSFARMAQDNGAAAVCVHGRSAVQLYGGQSDPQIIAQTKNAVNIPVLASGDALSPAQITQLLSQTHADGVLVARGARGNPWIFSGVSPLTQQRIEMALAHTRGLCDLDPAHGVARMRKHLSWYVAGLPHATNIRATLMRCSNRASLESLLCALIDSSLDDPFDCPSFLRL